MFGLVNLYMVLGHEVVKIGLHNIILADSNINKFYNQKRVNIHRHMQVFVCFCRHLVTRLAILTLNRLICKRGCPNVSTSLLGFLSVACLILYYVTDLCNWRMGSNAHCLKKMEALSLSHLPVPLMVLTCHCMNNRGSIG